MPLHIDKSDPLSATVGPVGITAPPASRVSFICRIAGTAPSRTCLCPRRQPRSEGWTEAICPCPVTSRDPGSPCPCRRSSVRSGDTLIGPTGIGGRRLGRLQHFWRWPLGLKLLTPVAWALIGVASGLLIVVPFRRLAPLMGRSLGAAALVPIADANQLRRARLIGRAVATAARFAPFRADCLPQAMAAVTFCHALNVPYAAFLGASMSTPDKPGELTAHAWVRCGPVPITGGTGNFQRFGVVACFVTPRLGVGTKA